MKGVKRNSAKVGLQQEDSRDRYGEHDQGNNDRNTIYKRDIMFNEVYEHDNPPCSVEAVPSFQIRRARGNRRQPARLRKASRRPYSMQSKRRSLFF